MPTEPSDVERAIHTLKEKRDAIDARIRELERSPGELGHQMEPDSRKAAHLISRGLARPGEIPEVIMICVRCGCWEGSLDSVRPCRGE